MFRDMFMFKVRDKGVRPRDLRLLWLSVDVLCLFRDRALEERPLSRREGGGHDRHARHRQHRQDTLQARQLKQCRWRQNRGRVKEG